MSPRYPEFSAPCPADTLYPGARHELVNETNRDEVTTDMLRDAIIPDDQS